MELACRLREDAGRERRLLVLAGSPGETRERARQELAATDLPPDGVSSVGPDGSLPWDRIDPDNTSGLMGTTREAVVLDCHGSCRPNAIGRAVGAVDGGGLLVLLTPPLSEWPRRRDGFDGTLAVPPFDREQVAGNFRRRLVETLRAHRGVAILDVESDTVESDGIVDGAPRLHRNSPTTPAGHAFPELAYESCRTSDQADALAAFERLKEGRRALVVEAHRGRGKSSVAGLAAASLALEGSTVLVTAPQYRNATPVFERARELLSGLGQLDGVDRSPDPQRLETGTGRIEYAKPTEAGSLSGEADCVIVDEAAALPVGLLEGFLEADAVAFTTTVHGYEGAGRGFSVRFRDRLGESDLETTAISLGEPIRYAPADPVEVWSFRALGLDASPPADQLVEGATPESVSYADLPARELLEDEQLLRNVFGLLVLAHYRTEPDDLARILDAPNVSLHALFYDGTVVAVALLAREGGLPSELRREMYAGERVRGNMLPDVLTSQLRDEKAGSPVGYRVLRIATHRAVRSRGLGSALLGEVREELTGRADYLGVGFGATPELLAFWRENGFSTVHLSTTRNERSGEHSAIMLDPLSAAGERLLDRHTAWFCRRIPSVLADPLSAVDPDVIRGGLAAVDATPDLPLSEFEWRVAAGIPGGASIFDTAPRAVRRLAIRHVVDPVDRDALSAREERLLVRKGLQAHPWSEVTEELGYPGPAACRRALGEAVGRLLDQYGDTEPGDRRSAVE